MAIKRKPKAKAKKRATRSSAGSGLKKFQSAMKKATKTVDTRIKKAEATIKKLKREKEARKKKALAAYRKRNK